MGTNSAVAPALAAEAVRSMAAELMRRDLVPPASLIGVAQLCRRVGALGQARALLERGAALDPENAEARALLDAFNGQHAQTSEVGPAPSRFVRCRHFLEASERDRVFDALRARLPEFVASEVDPDLAADGKYEQAERSSLVLYDASAVADIFLERMTTFLASTIYTLFDLEASQVDRIELQATCHGDEAFFSAHTDCGLARTNGRLISFVYYLHSQPKAFSGGELILFDANADANSYSRSAYTCIHPEDNSLIVFPSEAVHEVQAVSLPSGAMEQGRLTINGWVRATL